MYAYYFFEAGFQVSRNGKVGLKSMVSAMPGQIVFHLFKGICITRKKNDGCAHLGECNCAGFSNAPAASANQCGLVFKW
jgi:hypothetical protein